MHLLDMSTLSCFGGPDQGFKAQRLALSGFAGFGLTHRVLPNLDLPFAQSNSSIVNFKLRVKRALQSEVVQDILLYR